MVVFSASGSSERSTQSLLEVTTRVAPAAVRKISIPLVMPFSLVVTRLLHQVTTVRRSVNTQRAAPDEFHTRHRHAAR